MKFITILAVTFFAGMGAGLGTGFAGMSAAAVISPMLITFLGMDPYMAVGIALASDVLASAVSAYTYHKNKNLDVRNGLIMMAAVLLFTVVGSYIASLLPSHTMGGFSVFMTFLLGVKFIVRPVMTTKEAMQGVSAKKRAVQSVVCGVLIGFICGFVGAGGGADRCYLSLYHRRRTGLDSACPVRGVHADLGADRSGICQQSRAEDPEPRHWHCPCAAGRRYHGLQPAEITPGKQQKRAPGYAGGAFQSVKKPARSQISEAVGRDPCVPPRNGIRIPTPVTSVTGLE